MRTGFIKVRTRRLRGREPSAQLTFGLEVELEAAPRLRAGRLGVESLKIHFEPNKDSHGWGLNPSGFTLPLQSGPQQSRSP